MKAKFLRFVIAGLAAVVGLVLAVTIAKPPHEVSVAVLQAPIAAGVPITSADLSDQSVTTAWAKAAGLLTPSEAIGFTSAVALPVGVPIPAADRWVENIGSGKVALPLTVPEGNAQGVQTGSIVAVYKTTGGGNTAGDLLGTGVRVLAVDAPSGAPNPQTDEVVVLDVPATYAASMVGDSVVLGLMAGNPATQWTGTGGTLSTPTGGNPTATIHPPTSTRQSSTHRP